MPWAQASFLVIGDTVQVCEQEPSHSPGRPLIRVSITHFSSPFSCWNTKQYNLGHTSIIYIYIGSYINLLNELGEKKRREAFPNILSVSPTSLINGLSFLMHDFITLSDVIVIW